MDRRHGTSTGQKLQGHANLIRCAMKMSCLFLFHVLADKLCYRALLFCLRRATIAGGISGAVTPFFLQMVQRKARTLQHQAERPPPRLKPGGFSPSSMTSSPVAPWTIHSDASPQRDCRS